MPGRQGCGPNAFAVLAGWQDTAGHRQFPARGHPGRCLPDGIPGAPCNNRIATILREYPAHNGTPMRSPSPLLLILVAMITIACGCTQTMPTAPDPTTERPTATVLPATPTPEPSVTTMPAPPADPIIGSWLGYQYAASGRYEKVWTFYENRTWVMTNRNMKSPTTKVVKGKWSASGTATYSAVPQDGAPDTFTYDAAKDRLSDTYFQGTYTRFSGSIAPVTRPPSLEVTLNSAQAVLAINGSHPATGYRYLILNISVTNLSETAGYVFSDENARVTTPEMPVSKAINRKLIGKLEDPFPSEKIGIGETRQGNVIFGIPEASGSFTFRLIGDNGNAIAEVITRETIWRNASYSRSPG